MTSRDTILARVRTALADLTDIDRVGHIPPAPRIPVPADLVGHFAERVADYQAVVETTTPAGLQAAVTTALPPGASVVIPPGLSFAVPGAAVDDGTLSALDLDHVDAVITEATVGIAETGTIVLDHGPGQGRRIITLVPDHHVCVIHAHQIVPDVPDALTLLAERDPTRPQTWISGPSATSDIELTRVEGVHGPRHLHVIIVTT